MKAVLFILSLLVSGTFAGQANAFQVCNQYSEPVAIIFNKSVSHGVFSGTYHVAADGWYILQPDQCMGASLIYDSNVTARFQFYATTRQTVAADKRARWTTSQFGDFGSRNPSLCLFNSAVSTWPISGEVDAQTCAAAGGAFRYLRDILLNNNTPPQNGHNLNSSTYYLTCDPNGLNKVCEHISSADFPTGGARRPAPPPPAPPIPSVAGTTWSGTICYPRCYRIVWTLNANGAITSTSPDAPNQPPLTGRWTQTRNTLSVRFSDGGTASGTLSGAQFHGDGYTSDGIRSSMFSLTRN